MGGMKIIVRAPNWIGDAILSIPVLISLQKNDPEAELWVLARDWVKDLFGPGLRIAGLIPLPDSGGWKSLRQASRRVREKKFDLGLLLTNSLASAFLFYLARIPQRWGYSADGRALLLTRSVVPRKTGQPVHLVEYYRSLLAGLGLRTVEPEVRLTVTPEEKAWAADALARAGLDPGKPLVILNPGAHFGPAKRWPADRFGRTALILQKEKNAEIAIIGSAYETGLADEVSAQMEKKPAVFSGKTTLRQLLGLISRASLFITNDSGPMHMANALGIPVVALFGPTDPAVTRPFHPPSIVLKKDVPCWPCFYRKCPYDHRCLVSIEPGEAAEASQNFLP